jgi:hypothetical protein
MINPWVRAAERGACRRLATSTKEAIPTGAVSVSTDTSIGAAYARRIRGKRPSGSRRGGSRSSARLISALDSPFFKEAVIEWAAEVLPKSVKPAVMTRYLTSVAKLYLQGNRVNRSPDYPELYLGLGHSALAW